MKRKGIGVMVFVGVFLSVLVALAMAAQDKYTVKVPNELSFSDFRGYENWQVVAVSQTENLLKAMVANPTISVRIPDALQDVFLIEKDKKTFPGMKGWAYDVVDYEPATDTFKPDASGVVTCGFTCHTRVAAKDYIFTAYGKR
jgi:hypothetical protein